MWLPRKLIFLVLYLVLGMDALRFLGALFQKRLAFIFFYVYWGGVVVVKRDSSWLGLLLVGF